MGRFRTVRVVPRPYTREKACAVPFLRKFLSPDMMIERNERLSYKIFGIGLVRATIKAELLPFMLAD